MYQKLVFATFIVFASLACDAGPEPAPQLLLRPFRFKSYSFDQCIVCYCRAAFVWMRIDVINNEIVDIKQISTDTTLAKDQWRIYKSVNDLFAIIETYKRDTVASFTYLEYDSTYGYPKSFFIDPNPITADEEFGYECRNFTPIE